MRLLVTFATVGVFGFLATHASADDLYPPDWRTDPPGQGFTTFQMWEFGTDDNPVGPDVVYNAFGDPTATITGDWPLTLWKDEDFGHYGVWRFEDWMELFIPNNPEPEESKYIWLQITFSAGEGHDPPGNPESARLGRSRDHQPYPARRLLLPWHLSHHDRAQPRGRASRHHAARLHALRGRNRRRHDLRPRAGQSDAAGGLRTPAGPASLSAA